MLKLAWLILQLAGLDDAERMQWLTSLYGAFERECLLKPMKLNAFVGGLFHRARERALELQQMGLSLREIADRLREEFDVDIPHSIGVHNWLRGNITPLRLTKENLWALRYISGVAVGDYRRTGNGLWAKDRAFVEFYAYCYKQLTGKETKVVEVKNRKGFYKTTESGRFVQYLVRSGLWRAIAIIDCFDETWWWLSGLLDSEGSIAPDLYNGSMHSVVITLSSGSKYVIDLAALIFRMSGHTPYIRQRTSHKRVLKGRECIFGPVYDLFVNIGFNTFKRMAPKLRLAESKKREKLEYLLSIADLTKEERYKKWIEDWMKSPNGRWIRKKI